MNDLNKRKIELLADKQFNKEIGSAIKYIFENRQIFDCDEYYAEFTPSEKTYADNILYEFALKEYGKKAVHRDPMGSLDRIKCQILPKAHERDFTLTKEKVLDRIVMHKKNTANYIMKFGVFLTIFIYLFAIPISFFEKDFMTLLDPVPTLIFLFVLFYIIKIWNLRAIEKAKQKGFNIIKATCTSVKSNPEYGEANISSNNVRFNKNIPYTDYNLDDSLKKGGSYYLIIVNENVKSVFSADEYKLDAELSEMLK